MTYTVLIPYAESTKENPMKSSHGILRTLFVMTALLAVILAGTAADAAGFGKPLVALRMPIPAGLAGMNPAAAGFPELKDEFRKIEETVRKRIDFLPDQDLKEIRFFVLDDGGTGCLSEEMLLVQLKGKLDQGRLMPALPNLISMLEKKSLGEGAVKIGSKDAVKGKLVTVFFSAPDTLCIASHKTAILAIEAGDSFFAQLESQAQPTASTIDLQVEAARLLERQPEFKNQSGKIPEGIRLMLTSLQVGRLSVEAGVLRLKLDFSQSGGAEVGASMIDSFKSIAAAKLQEENGKLDQKADTMDPGALLLEWRMQKTLLAIGATLLKRITLEKSPTSLQLSIQLPELFKDANPLLMTSTVGVLAAIAIPNFQRAKMQARKSACFANQRVLLGAIEMYNMDNATMKTSLSPEDYGPGGVLVMKGYLTSGLSLPEPGCSYSSVGDLSKGGSIKCAIHGGVAEK